MRSRSLQCGMHIRMLQQGTHKTNGRVAYLPPKKLKADSMGFQQVCFILAETNVLALRRTRQKDITFFKCSFKLDGEDGLREEISFKAEYWEVKRQLQARLLELGCSGGLSICGTSSTQVQGR